MQEQRLELPIYKPKVTRGRQNLEEARKGTALETSEGTRPCQHRDLRLLAIRTETINFSVFFFKATPFVVICNGNSRKLIC